MISIKNFKLDRKKNINLLNKDLINFINSFVTDNDFNFFSKKCSECLNLKRDTIINESKVFIFRNFINKYGKFKKIISNNYLKYFFINLLLLNYVFIFRRGKPIKKKKYDLVIDLTHGTQYDYFEKISKKLNSIFILNKKDERYNFFIFKKFNRYSLPNNCKRYIDFLKLIFWSLNFSIKKKANFNYILFHFFKIYFRNHSIFLNIEAKFLIQERYNFTSPIKNEIFKTYGGILSTVVQRNIFQINGPGMFIYSDVIFSLGEETCKILKDLDGEVKEIHPVGSLFMEKNYFDRPNSSINSSKIHAYDLLVVAAPHVWDFISGYERYYDDYYLHFEWIKKFAIENPDLKIGIKHKNKLENPKELKIFEKIDNVFHLIDETKWKDTYLFGKNAKSICTWSSTLGHEFLSIQKECYYVDPDYNNQSFLPNYDFYKPIRLNTYEKFVNTIKSQIRGEKNMSVLNNSNKFCLSSENVSQKIAEFFQDRLK
tara:strand:- start:5703 stop:7157 length:1455 start_codon:yes stop_codon:yes gene_type:complete